MKSLKFLLIGIIAWTTHISTSAASYNAITITKTDGSVEYIQIQKLLSVNFENSTLKINSPSMNVEYLMGEVYSYTFGTQKFADIDNCTADTPAHLSIDGRNITINSASPCKVRIYSTTGNLLAESISGISINMSEFPAGAYIIKTDVKSFKIVLK